MGLVVDRLDKLAKAGLPVAAVRYFADEDALRAGLGAHEHGVSLRYEGARLRSASPLNVLESALGSGLDTALDAQKQALERARMLGLADGGGGDQGDGAAASVGWIVQETPTATLVEVDSRDAATGTPTGDDLVARAEAALGRPLKLTITEGVIFDVEPLNLASQAKFAALVDMVENGSLSQTDGLRLISAPDLEELLHPRLAPGGENLTIARGINASPGAVAGRIYFSARDAIDVAQTSGAGPVLLVRKETTPEDIRAITVAAVNPPAPPPSPATRLQFIQTK